MDRPSMMSMALFMVAAGLIVALMAVVIVVVRWVMLVVMMGDLEVMLAIRVSDSVESVRITALPVQSMLIDMATIMSR